MSANTINLIKFPVSFIVYIKYIRILVYAYVQDTRPVVEALRWGGCSWSMDQSIHIELNSDRRTSHPPPSAAVPQYEFLSATCFMPHSSGETPSPWWVYACILLLSRYYSTFRNKQNGDRRHALFASVLHSNVSCSSSVYTAFITSPKIFRLCYYKRNIRTKNIHFTFQLFSTASLGKQFWWYNM